MKEEPEPEEFVVKAPKPVIPPEGYRLPSDKERDKLGQMSTEIDRLRGLIPATSGKQKKELIRQRRDLNIKQIGYMEKHKVYYVPLGQTQKAKFTESIADEVRKELLVEGGPGSGYYGHAGRPGFVGGSRGGGAGQPFRWEESPGGGVEFKDEKNQLLYNEYLEKYSKWELSDFKKNFYQEVGPKIENSLGMWQGTTTNIDALAFKYKAHLIEKNISMYRYPRLMTEGEIEALRFEVKKISSEISNESYIKLRALTQAYYKKINIKTVDLYRGIGGNTGKKYSKHCRELQKLHTDEVVFRKLEMNIKEDGIVGYPNAEKVGQCFGVESGGITVIRKMPVNKILVCDPIWPKFLTNEFIVIGGDSKLKMEQIRFYKR